jgi:hypothetical protein
MQLIKKTINKQKMQVFVALVGLLQQLLLQKNLEPKKQNSLNMLHLVMLLAKLIL